MMRKAIAAAPILTFILLAVLLLLVYAAGLHGGFLFDDFANLPALGTSGPVHHWATFWSYISSGRADPTGRPLALLSFLIDARDWPADPFPFKRTSLILHLTNGVLLLLLLRRIGLALIKPPGGPFPSAFDASSIERTKAIAWRVNMAASLGAGFWLLHPLFVSTTLYIVQREAMLPATFVLLGLLSWLHGRRALLNGRTLNGLTWIVLGLGVCTLLAVLSKANGILLPALALAVEYTVLRHGNVAASKALPQSAEAALSPLPETQDSETSEADHEGVVGTETLPKTEGNSRGRGDRTERLWRWRAYGWTMRVMGWVPAILVAGYLLYRGWSGLTRGIGRPWTLGQRLLTEPRILMDYLGLLWLPRPFTPGLFNDHIQVSTSLLSPTTTLAAIITVLCLITGACLMRQRWPALAMAMLFYFVGQSLESSTIALELYFEHRNYLPAMLMFWPLALWLCGVRQTGFAGLPQGTRARDVASTPSVSPDIWRRAKTLLAVVLLLGLAAMTWARADLWGNTHDQALLWATLNPDSPRAQANAAQAEMHASHPELAVARLQPAVAKAPNEVQLTFNLFAAKCQMGYVDAATIKAAETSLELTRDPGTLLTSWFNRVISQSANPSCPQANLATVQHLLDAAKRNTRLMDRAGRRQDMDYLQGRIALARGDGDAALADFNLALDQQVRISAALEQAAQLGSAGFPHQGLAHLDHYEAERSREHRPPAGMPRIHAWVLNRQQYWQKELARLRATLRDDARQQATTSE